MISNSSGGHTRLYWAKQAAMAFVNEIAGGPAAPPSATTMSR